jgi:hypothetical protein
MAHTQYGWAARCGGRRIAPESGAAVRAANRPCDDVPAQLVDSPPVPPPAGSNAPVALARP